MRKAFTLIELLVVISIIAMLIALLLPSLGQARYQVRVIKCLAQMRGMTQGVLLYANDHNLYYPDSETGRRSPGTIAQTWSSAYDDQEFDFRDAFRKYFGTQLNDVMKCPLKSDFWDDDAFNRDDIDNYVGNHSPGHVQTPYAFYFGRRGIDPNGGSLIDSSWPRDEVMLQIDDAFVPSNPHVSKKEFQIVMSDFVYQEGFFGRGALTTHAPPHNNATQQDSYINSNAGFLYPLSSTALANFALNDGSAATYRLTGASIDTGQFTGIRRQTGAQTYMVPTELGR